MLKNMQIAGVNWGKGIDNLNGNAELLLSFHLEFYRMYADLVRLKLFWSEVTNESGLRRLIHTIGSQSALIGADDIQIAANNVEHAKDNDKQTSEAINALYNSIEKYVISFPSFLIDSQQISVESAHADFYCSVREYLISEDPAVLRYFRAHESLAKLLLGEKFVLFKEQIEEFNFEAALFVLARRV